MAALNLLDGYDETITNFYTRQASARTTKKSNGMMNGSASMNGGDYTPHPLEPLTRDEIQAAVAILKDTGKVTATTRFISVVLKEPPKSIVYQYTATGAPTSIDRMADVVLFDNKSNSCFEAQVSITASTVMSWKSVPGVQPTITPDECAECEAAVQNNEEFIAKLKSKYGIEDSSLVMVDIWSAGNYGSEEDSTMRLARPLCFLREDPTDNGYAKPIEGLRPVVDLNSMTVLRVEEYDVNVLPPAAGNYAAERMASFQPGPMPLDITQPQGPSFTVHGNAVEWQNWKFVVGFNSREGLTLHNLSYAVDGAAVPVMYRASLSEMVVPYGDPAPQQARKNAFDAGEYGIGLCTNSLTLGCDCLGYIKYFDGEVCTSKGEPVTIQNAVCMHEEDVGVLWKHTDRRIPEKPEVRRSRRLVISSMATVENYEYGFFWHLYQDGNIEFEAKMTGILSLGTLEHTPGTDPAFGTMIDPLLYAPNHQHFFNMRLDMDVGGPNNSVYQLDIVGDDEGEANPFMNAFRAKKTLLESEKAAAGHLNMDTDRTWKVVNPSVLNKTGMPIGYKFFPGMNCKPFAHKGAWWRKRAGFCDYHMWVTQNDPDQMHAAGWYPNQSSGGDGLPKWVEADRSLVDTDVVLWYTFGHTHIPRLEDYPVMPTATVGFLLKPNGFFPQNPGNDLPPPRKKYADSANGSSNGCCA